MAKDSVEHHIIEVCVIVWTLSMLQHLKFIAHHKRENVSWASIEKFMRRESQKIQIVAKIQNNCAGNTANSEVDLPYAVGYEIGLQNFELKDVAGATLAIITVLCSWAWTQECFKTLMARIEKSGKVDIFCQVEENEVGIIGWEKLGVNSKI